MGLVLLKKLLVLFKTSTQGWAGLRDKELRGISPQGSEHSRISRQLLICLNNDFANQVHYLMVQLVTA